MSTLQILAMNVKPKYHCVQLQPAAVFTVVGVLAVGEVFGHQPQGRRGKRSADQVEHQRTFDLHKGEKAGSHLSRAGQRHGALPLPPWPRADLQRLLIS